MQLQINQIAVVGSGVMGSRIAALFANVGIKVKLFDVVPDNLDVGENRNKLAANAIQNLLTQKPYSFTSKKNTAFIEACNLEDDLEKLTSCDWIIEAIVENLQVKRDLYAIVDQYRRPGSIVSSNTSGISIEKMAEGRSEDFQQNFLGTHFFNPPRYLKLVEVIPTKATAENIIIQVSKFAEDVLGKGVVLAKDTPNFIGNRIGTYGLIVTVREMIARGLTVGEVDSLTGTLIGRPKSATFRTLDVVGLDTFSHVVSNVHENIQSEDREVFVLPDFIKQMVASGALGSKTGKGFYWKQGKEIQELNWQTGQYETVTKCKAESIEQSKQEKTFAQKLQRLVYANDRAGEFLWATLSEVCLYAAQLVGEIADDIVSIDNAMKWGFGWEYGPFALWDAIGLDRSVSRIESEGRTVPEWVKELLSSGNSCFYQDSSYYHDGTYKQLSRNEKVIYIDELKKTNKIIKKNSSATLLEFGDGIALLEMHSRNNAISSDLCEMISFAIDEVDRNYDGLVIASQGKHFCVGANLAMMLLEAQDDNLFEIDQTIRTFQQVTMKIKYASKPVVVAPYQMTLGGGTEICIPAARVQATTETYLGLVEVGVGLIPAGGGCKELYLKHLKKMPNGVQFDLQNIANKVFETISLALVSTSADEIFENNFLQKGRDGISRNADHQLYDAKQAAIALVKSNYQAPVPRSFPVVGETGYATLVTYAESMRAGGYISAHDLLIAKKLAYVISGGKVPFGTEVSEEYLLDLEREAFLDLVVQPKTQERMAHMLTKRKPLRN